MHKFAFILTVLIRSSSDCRQVDSTLVVADFELKVKSDVADEFVVDSHWFRDVDSVDSNSLLCVPLRGFVKNYQNSSVVLTRCGHYTTGLVFIEDKVFEVVTLNGELQISSKKYKRSIQDRIDSQWEYFNLTGDVFNLGYGDQSPWLDDEDPEFGQGEETTGIAENFVMKSDDEDNEVHNDWNWRSGYENIDGDQIAYFFDSAWQPEVLNKKKYHHNHNRNYASGKKWLEVALAVDHTVISFHGHSRVEAYILSLMNIVNAIYRDSSLNANLHLAITRLLLFPHRKQSVIRPGNAKRSLENVNAWNERLHLSLSPGETHHDIAVWLTRADIGGPSGYAPVSGVCDPRRSCSLNRDEGLTSAFIIAHEMAHILGLSHDGDKEAKNECEEEGNDGSVMASMVSATFNKFAWSECSRREFRRRINKWHCLSNIPEKAAGAIFLNDTLDISFSMDEQCRMEFGEGYVLCRSFDIPEPCAHLWCGLENKPLVCKTKKGPPLEGTECGFNKWCVNGYCQQKDQSQASINPIVNNPQDGGWGNWSSWGSCSRSCGTGVSFRTRTCNNPIPSYGGSHCFGLNEEWQICNTSDCPEPIKDIRMQQCKRLPKLIKLSTNLTWSPYESEEYAKKCKLICISKETKEVRETTDNLIDGSPCSYETTHDICIQGVCHTLGCDHKLFSSVSEDLCGVCGGNNSQCTNVKSAESKKLRKDISRLAILPRFSRSIKMEANFSTVANNTDPLIAFVLKDRKRKTYTITIPNAGVYSDIIEGAKFYYKKIFDRHHIWAKGPLLTEMLVLIYSSRSDVKSGINITFSYDYYMDTDVLKGSKRYQWILGGWGPCSQTCGGGKRHKTVACFDSQKKKIVPRKFCSLLGKPVLDIEKCNNFSCSFHWISGGWEPCSATCGAHGLQQREIYCVPQSVTYNRSIYSANDAGMSMVYRQMVHPEKCFDYKPAQMRPCHRVTCPLEWTYGPWSSCSASCGFGLSTRQSSCPTTISESNNFYSCGDNPHNVRHCYGDTRHTNPKCRYRNRDRCVADESPFCGAPELQMYCKIRGFRRVCCKSCVNFKDNNAVDTSM